MSERISAFVRTMRLDDLQSLRDRNSELAKLYRRNADKMDEIVRAMDEEIESRK